LSSDLAEMRKAELFGWHKVISPSHQPRVSAIARRFPFD
jgi:hypothetical protein